MAACRNVRKRMKREQIEERVELGKELDQKHASDVGCYDQFKTTIVSRGLIPDGPLAHFAASGYIMDI
eukprot:1354444-Amorphochlora_amoeboformis.AAC.1